MTLQEFEEIMESDFESPYTKDDIFRGLLIIRKYIPFADIEAAEHDEVFCVDTREIVNLIFNRGFFDIIHALVFARLDLFAFQLF